MRLLSGLFFAVSAIAAIYGAGAVHAETATQIFAAENCIGDRSMVRLSWIGVDPEATEVSLLSQLSGQRFQGWHIQGFWCHARKPGHGHLG